MNAVSRQRTPAMKPRIGARRKGDVLTKAATATFIAHMQRIGVEEVVRERYGGDFAVVTMAKAATSPATMSDSAWAGALVREEVAGFIQSTRSKSVYGALVTMMDVPPPVFDEAGRIRYTQSNDDGELAGDFVGEAEPIPVKEGGFASTILSPKKLAVITTLSREIAKQSQPPAEETIGAMLRDDTTEVLDARLLDDVAATDKRPAGLLYGVTQQPAASGIDPVANVTADLHTLLDPLLAQKATRPVLLMNPARALGLRLTVNANGVFVFATDIGNDELGGVEVVVSHSVPSGTVIALDLDTFVTASGGLPELLVSEAATLHMENATPAPIVGGTPAAPVPAVPTRSLFQTATLGLRLIVMLDWAMRRPGLVTAITGVQW